MIYRLLILVLLTSIALSSFGTALAQGPLPPSVTKGEMGVPYLTQADALSKPSTGNNSVTTSPILNGNFEQGASTGWISSSSNGFQLILSSGFLPLRPHSGSWAAWLGGGEDETSSILQSQFVSIASPATLRLWYWIASQETTCGHDFGYVKLNHTTTIYTFNLCEANNSGGWQALDLSMNAYNGFVLQLSIDAQTDHNGLNSNLFIDDVSLYTTFADVPVGYWAESFIERLYNAGVTGGCGTAPLLYCPETTVNRAQMAVFLLRGIHGSAYTPPAVGDTTGFSDVPTNYWAAAWIKELAAEGITGGCGVGLYCPETAVTRDQMAVFLLRSEHGAAYSPPAVVGGTGFGDVPDDHWAAAWIKQLVTEGITAGCGGGNYCPNTVVNRAQMAVFLVRTFALP